MTNRSNNNSSAPPLEEILTLEEVAAWLKVEPRQVVRYGVPCVRLGHKTLRFMRGDVLAWLEQQRQQHNPTPTQGEL